MRVTSSVPFVSVSLACAAVACGSASTAPSPTQPGSGAGFVITISNLSFSPLDLHVPPGGTVTVVNQDGMAHSVTSEAAQNAFAPGAVGGVAFDTGPFTGTTTFTIPANAPNGTTIPYFCSVHRGTMKTPNGAITVDASAQPAAPPSPPPGGGGGGY